MKRLLILTLPVSFLLLVGCADSLTTTASATEQDNEAMSPPDLSAEEIAIGEGVYANNCASCHGENLEGEADWKQQNEDGSFRSPPHTADGHTWHHADSVLIEAIRKGGARFEGMNIGGTSNMPAFSETLTDDEILAVLTYIKSTWPEDVRAMQWQQTAQDTSS